MLNKFDKLNNLDHDKKWIDYNTYFGEMRLSDIQKKMRIEMAKEIEDIFLMIFSLITVMKESNQKIDWVDIHSKLNDKYIRCVGKPKASQSLINYIDAISWEIVSTTMKNIESDYFLSQERAMNIAANESNAVNNTLEYEQAIKDGYSRKKWKAIIDERTRKDHFIADGQTVPINGLFTVGESLMRYPHDIEAPIGQTIGCRCSIEYLR